MIYLPAFFILLIAVIILLVIFRKKGKENEEEETSLVERKKGPDIHIGPEFREKNQIETREGGHSVKVLLLYKHDDSTWTCPRCEMENKSSLRRCELCHSEREVG